MPDELMQVKMPDDYWRGYLDAVAHADHGLTQLGPDMDKVFITQARMVVCSLAQVPYQYGYQPEWCTQCDNTWRQ